MVTFEDPKGTVMEVFRPPEPLKQTFHQSGVVPHKLGHIAFHVTDVQADDASFYCDVLGFRVSDWMGDFFSFLRCGPDHHTINLVETGKNKHFHTAFELRDWAHMQTASISSASGYKMLWGPGRHGIGHNLFSYHRSPNGLITELFAELDQMKDEALGYFEPRPWHRDNPQRPKAWAKDSIGLQPVGSACRRTK